VHPDAGGAREIMAKVAANIAAATDGRRQFVYQQRVRASLVRNDGQIARRETRTYAAVPQERSTDKTLITFDGEYLAGKKMAQYSAPGVKDKGNSEDRETLQSLAEGLVNAPGAKDGIPRTLFPLQSEELTYYKFLLKGESTLHDRQVYDIVFEPVDTGDLCIHVGGDEENACHQWKGEVWVDAEDYQPVRIETQLAKGVPWGVRVFLGINVRQYGFTIDYQRVAPDVWFPVSYGTEFHLAVLWGYKRTVTLAMDNTDFRRTRADSEIHYDLKPQIVPQQ
jgi:hypothetical protein